MIAGLLTENEVWDQAVTEGHQPLAPSMPCDPAVMFPVISKVHFGMVLAALSHVVTTRTPSVRDEPCITRNNIPFYNRKRAHGQEWSAAGV